MILTSSIPDWCIRVWCAIRSLQGADGRTCVGTADQIAERCGKTANVVYHARKELEGAGFLIREGKGLRCSVIKSDGQKYDACTGHPLCEESAPCADNLHGVQTPNGTKPAHHADESAQGAGSPLHPPIRKKPTLKPTGDVRARRASSLPQLRLDEDLRAYAGEKAPDVDPDLEFESFVNWCHAKGRRYKDYRRAFQNWLLKAQKWNAENRRRPMQRPRHLDLTQPVTMGGMQDALSAFPQLARGDFWEKGTDWKGNPLYMLKLGKRREIGVAT